MEPKLYSKFRPITKPFGWTEEYFNDTNNPLVIAFSSSREHYDWKETLVETLSDLNLNLLFVMDASDVWWHGPFPGLNKYGAVGLKEFFEEKINKIKPSKIITIGASKGGYGAVLFGSFLNVDLVMAFSPQREVLYDNLGYYHIPERFKKLEEMYPDFKMDTTYMKFENVLSLYGDKTIYNIFYGNRNIEDSKAAKLVQSIKGNSTNLYEIETEDHKVAHIFKKEGTIEKIIRDFLKEGCYER
jgi:hypothetical protein